MPSNQLLPFQMGGMKFLRQTQLDGCLLADQPGLGKTVQAARAMATRTGQSILIVCPAVMREKWRMEIEKWAGLKAQVMTANMNYVPGGRPIIVSHNVLSYPDKPLMQGLFARKWQVLVVDEAHAFKEPKSKRTRTLYGHGRTRGLRNKAEKTWLLTGTPALNHAAELYPHIKAFIPGAIWDHDTDRPMTYADFVVKYCLYRDTVYGRQITGSKNGKHLRTLLYDSHFMLRRMAKDVMPELPRLRVTETVMGYVPGVKVTQAEITAAIATSETECDPNGNPKNTPAMKSAMHAFALHKLPSAIQYITTTMEGAGNDHKALVFGIHHDVIDQLMTDLGAFYPVKIDGRDSDRVRQEAINTFQTNPDCRVFIGQIDACGVGIDLTAARSVFMVEPHPSPEKNFQAILRARRIGTKYPVLAEYLCLDMYEDRRIQAALAQKTEGLRDMFY